MILAALIRRVRFVIEVVQEAQRMRRAAGRRHHTVEE